jgi:hypothetical protein
MAVILFRCPYTNSHAQAVVDAESADETTFEPVSCPACLRRHLVNPKTGRVLGSEE